MKKISCIIFALVVANNLFAANEKYRIMISDDPATTMTIGWNQISGIDPTVYYDVVDHGTDYSSYANSQAVDRAIAYRGMNNRFVRLTGLLPNTSYYFVINDSEGASERFWFKTTPDDLSRLSFITGGDSRNNQIPRQRANLLVSKLKPHAVFFGGDMTEDDNSAQWKEWLDDWQLTIAPDGRMFPILAARGNHEGSVVTHNLLDTPNPDSYYAITFGDNLVRTYTLNTEISVFGNQRDWLENDLSTHTDAVWKMAQYHKPMRPHTVEKSEGGSEYNAWAQLFYDFRMSLVIDCDSHVAKTTWPLKPATGIGSDEGFIRDDLKGTVFIGEGCWGAPLRDADDNKEWTRNSAAFNQFNLVFVDPISIEIRTINVNNAASVAEGLNDDPFLLPANLNVWNPSNGAVIEIFPPSSVADVDIEFTNLNGTLYPDGSNVLMELEVLSSGSGINDVQFYINNSLTDTDDLAPYNFIENYTDGVFSVEAFAEDALGQSDAAKTNIIVGSFTQTSNFPIVNGIDDVEETEAGLSYNESSDLEMAFDDFTFDGDIPNGFQVIGLRFQDVLIPAGATITSAYIQFRADETDGIGVNFLISMEDVGDAVAYDENTMNTVTGRTMLPDIVPWAPPVWASGDWTAAQRTPDLAALLTQVVNRSDWQPGNSMSFKIEATGQSLTNENSIRVADSYDGSSEFPPTLVVSYSFDQMTDAITTTYSEVGVRLFPNPCSNLVTLSSFFNRKIDLFMHNSEGRVVLTDSMETKTNSKEIDCSGLPNGVYFIEGVDKNGNKLFIEKLIKY